MERTPQEAVAASTVLIKTAVSIQAGACASISQSDKCLEVATTAARQEYSSEPS